MKRGQMKLSFGMIFSIILIIIFIAFAFFAVTKILELQQGMNVGTFIDNLQTNVDKLWKSPQGSYTPIEGFALSKKVQSVCFIDYNSPNNGGDSKIYNELQEEFYDNKNLFFYPLGSAEDFSPQEIKHIDLEAITKEKNPKCFRNINGKVKMTLTQSAGGTPLVEISD